MKSLQEKNKRVMRKMQLILCIIIPACQPLPFLFILLRPTEFKGTSLSFNENNRSKEASTH